MKKIFLLLAFLTSFSCYGQKRVIDFKIHDNKIEYTCEKDTIYNRSIWVKQGETYVVETSYNNKSTVFITETIINNDIYDDFLTIKINGKAPSQMIYSGSGGVIILIVEQSTYIYNTGEFYSKYGNILSVIINKLQK